MSLADLVSLVGILVALALYVMLLVTASRQRLARGPAERRRPAGTALAVGAGLLGVAWNAGAAAFLVLSHARRASLPEEALRAVAFGALGFLVAVFVDAAVRPWGSHAHPAAVWVRRAAYAMAGVAAALHAAQPMLGRATPSVPGLRLLAIGSLGIVPFVLWTAPRGQRLHRGLLSAAAVLASALCALHLAEHLPGTDTWSAALFGHHASLPLIVAILYQDYRFAFADLFLKRALALTLLAGIVLGLYLAVVGPILSAGAGRPGTHPAPVWILGLWVATALAFPSLQRLTNRFVDSVVLRRPDYARLRADIAELASGLDSAEPMLDGVCVRLAAALRARVTWSRLDETGPAPTNERSEPSTIVLPTHEPPRFTLEVRELPPGKRLLSDDVVLLDAVASSVARRLDSVRLVRERCERDYREQEIARLATEAELRALRAQLNPHFLFNALNTIGYLMRAAPDRAFGTLLDLTRLLRAVLKRSGDFVTLGQELELVRAYLAIESARFEDRLRTVIDVPPALLAWQVPPLVLQPLVENAIKHGITLRAEGGEVSVVARASDAEGMLVVYVVDSGVGTSDGAITSGRKRGLGLSSVERRLAAYYGEAASIDVTSRPGLGTRATLRIPPRPAPALLDARREGPTEERTSDRSARV